MTTAAEVIDQLSRPRPDGMYPGLVRDFPRKESVELQVWVDMRKTDYTGVSTSDGQTDPILRIDFEVAYQADFDHETDWLWKALTDMRDGDLASGDIPGVEGVRRRES